MEGVVFQKIKQSHFLPKRKNEYLFNLMIKPLEKGEIQMELRLSFKIPFFNSPAENGDFSSQNNQRFKKFVSFGSSDRI
jgi:hypothetical protein